MAVPNDRRVIYGTHIIPQESFSTSNTQVTREEGMTAGRASYTDYKLDETIGKKFGGKGIVTIAANQGTDSWTSMEHSQKYWETYDVADDNTGNRWEDTTHPWNGELSIANGSATAIRTGVHTVLIDFLYIKNTGSNEAKLALEGDEYDILIPAGAAVSMRVNDISSANIKVDTTSGTTTIEYVIAKTS